MRLGLLQLLRTLRRTAGLVLVVGILTALTLLVTAISSTLERSLSGAIANMGADVVVLTSASQGTPQASRISPEQRAALGGVRGVERVAAVGELRVTAVVDGREVDASLFGVEPGGPGHPRTLVSGRLPTGPGEVVIDEVDARRALGLGDRLSIGGTDLDLHVVGVAEGARFGGILTLHGLYDDWEAAFGQLVPDATELRPSLVAVDAAAGVDPRLVVDRINTTLDGLSARTPADAAEALPGLAGIRDSFNLISIVSIGAALLLIGAFWSLITAQQARTSAVLHATGVSRAALVRALVVQVLTVVVVGVTGATSIVLLLGRAAPPTFPLVPSPTEVITVLLVLAVGSLLAALPSIRRITRLDPLVAIAEADR